MNIIDAVKNKISQGVPSGTLDVESFHIQYSSDQTNINFTVTQGGVTFSFTVVR